MNKTRKIKIGGVEIGGGNDIAIQSMLCAAWDDVPQNISQAAELEAAGCEILRVAIPNMESLRLIPAIKTRVSLPIVADIHFDYRLAVEAAAAGADKIRLNPGNIGGRDKVKAVVRACREKGLPIRIGVNGGSLEREILARHGSATPQAMADSALAHAAMLESLDFDNIVISIKSSGVKAMADACRIVAEKRDYPLHLGVTEAGPGRMGLIRSAVGIGSLLMDGVGDTIRVSLSADPTEEIAAAQDILKAVGRNKSGVTVISCPTCGRASLDVISLAALVEEAFSGYGRKLTVAVMGCEVNGPGEAREADIGVCGGRGKAALFAGGRVISKVSRDEIIPALLRQAELI